MNMTWDDIIRLLITLISGGAAGAIIKSIIDKRRNKIQSISKTVDISNISIPEYIIRNYLSKIALSGSTTVYHFDNLFIAKIEILNSGNKDFNEFIFGITLPDDVFAVNIQLNGRDRHHLIYSNPEIDLDNGSSKLDFRLSPFNRKDKYKIELLISSSRNHSDIVVDFSTNSPVKFVDSSTITVSFLEILSAVAKGLTQGTIEISKLR